MSLHMSPASSASCNSKSTSEDPLESSRGSSWGRGPQLKLSRSHDRVSGTLGSLRSGRLPRETGSPDQHRTFRLLAVGAMQGGLGYRQGREREAARSGCRCRSTSAMPVSRDLEWQRDHQSHLRGPSWTVGRLISICCWLCDSIRRPSLFGVDISRRELSRRSRRFPRPEVAGITVLAVLELRVRFSSRVRVCLK